MHYVGDSGSLLRFLVRKREMEKRKSKASIEVDRDERKKVAEKVKQGSPRH